MDFGLWTCGATNAAPAVWRVKLGIESRRRLRQVMHVKATIKRRPKSDAEVLDHATSNLLRAIKCDMLKTNGRVDREKLRKDGYSDRLLDRLERA